MVFVAYLLFRPRPVPLAALTVTDYRSPLNPNALAAEDLRRFEAAFKGYRNIRFSSAMEGATAIGKPCYAANCSVFVRGSGNGRLFPDNDIVLLFLSAHGVVDSQARPCLLMSGSDPLDQRTWIPALDVVAYVNEFVSSSRKALILDSGRIRENLPAGILHNGFADALQVALQESRSKACSCSIPRGLTSEAMRRLSWAGWCSPGLSQQDCAVRRIQTRTSG